MSPRDAGWDARDYHGAHDERGAGGTLQEPHPTDLAGRWVTSSDRLDVDDPTHPARPAGATYLTTDGQAEEAVEAAARGFEAVRWLPAFERSRALRALVAELG